MNANPYAAPQCELSVEPPSRPPKLSRAFGVILVLLDLAICALMLLPAVQVSMSRTKWPVIDVLFMLTIAFPAAYGILADAFVLCTRFRWLFPGRLAAWFSIAASFVLVVLITWDTHRRGRPYDWEYFAQIIGIPLAHCLWNWLYIVSLRRHRPFCVAGLVL